MKKDEKEFKIEEVSEGPDTKENEVVEAPKEEPVAPQEPLVHVDTFLENAMHLFGIDRITAHGFKLHMSGRWYQFGFEPFIKELEDYLNKKLR